MKNYYDEDGNVIRTDPVEDLSSTKDSEWQELWHASASLCQSVILGLRAELQHQFGDDFPELRLVAFRPISDYPHTYYSRAINPRRYRVLDEVILEYTVRRIEPTLDEVRENGGEDQSLVSSVTRTLNFPITFFRALAKRDIAAINQFGEIVLSAYRCDVAISKLEYLFHTDVDRSYDAFSTVDGENTDILRRCKKSELISAVEDVAGQGSRIVILRGRPLNAKSFLLDITFLVYQNAAVREMPTAKTVPYFKTDSTEYNSTDYEMGRPIWNSEDLFRITTVLQFDRVHSPESYLHSLFDLARDFAALLLGATADGSLAPWESESGICCPGCHQVGSACWCGTFPGTAVAPNFSDPIAEFSGKAVVYVVDDDDDDDEKADDEIASRRDDIDEELPF